MSKAPFEVWIEEVKDICRCEGYDYDKLADRYSFRQACDEFDCYPEEAVMEACAS
jgi:hypothetical protein